MAAVGATAAGLILGTAAYMSPEQARGKTVDARTDIWAFGCVVYEMLAGRKAFPGDTVTDVLAAVVRAEPEWSGLPDPTPTTIRKLLRRCLQKDPSRRLHHIADARIEIDDVIVEPATAPGVVSPAGRRALWMRAVPWALAALMTVAVLVMISTTRHEAPPAIGVTRVDLNLPSGLELPPGSSGILAIAPGGDRLAFIGMGNGARRVYVRRFDQLESQPLGGTQGTMACFFSPDGNSLGIVLNNGNLKRISLADGLVTTVTTGADLLLGASWTRGDRIVYVHAGTLWDVPASGGTPTQLIGLDSTRHARADENALTSAVAMRRSRSIHRGSSCRLLSGNHVEAA